MLIEIQHIQECQNFCTYQNKLIERVEFMVMLPLTPILIMLSTFIGTSKMSSDRKTQFFIFIIIVLILVILFGIILG